MRQKHIILSIEGRELKNGKFSTKSLLLSQPTKLVYQEEKGVRGESNLVFSVLKEWNQNGKKDIIRTDHRPISAQHVILSSEKKKFFLRESILR